MYDIASELDVALKGHYTLQNLLQKRQGIQSQLQYYFSAGDYKMVQNWM